MCLLEGEHDRLLIAVVSLTCIRVMYDLSSFCRASGGGVLGRPVCHSSLNSCEKSEEIFQSASEYAVRRRVVCFSRCSYLHFVTSLTLNSEIKYLVLIQDIIR